MKALVKFFKEKFVLPKLLGVTPDAEERRNELALTASKVTAVATASGNDMAVGISRDIQTYIKMVKEAGLEFRRPINDFAALVKRTEDDHLAPLLVEKERLDALALGFAQREKQRVADEERKRNEEFQRREQARLAEEKRLADERAAKQAELDRIQAVKDEKLRKEREAAEALAAAAKNKKQREEAEAMRQAALRKQAAAEVERQKRETALRERAEKDKAAADAAIEANRDLLRQPLPQAAKAAGSSVRQKLMFEVVSEAEVYKHRPELCKIEVKASAVQSTCVAREGANAVDKDTTTVPGLRLWWADSLTTHRR